MGASARERHDVAARGRLQNVRLGREDLYVGPQAVTHEIVVIRNDDMHGQLSAAMSPVAPTPDQRIWLHRVPLSQRFAPAPYSE